MESDIKWNLVITCVLLSLILCLFVSIVSLLLDNYSTVKFQLFNRSYHIFLFRDCVPLYHMVSVYLLREKLIQLKRAHGKDLDVAVVNSFLSVADKALVIVTYRCFRVSKHTNACIV